MKKKHLPVFGVGPMIVCVMMILEIIGIILARRMRDGRKMVTGFVWTRICGVL